jgi:3-phytase
MNRILSHTLTATILFGSLSTLAAVPEVSPVFETRSHFDDEAGSFTDVDDPAIWIHPHNKAQSLIVGTLKEGGIDVYNLNGELLQHIPAAKPPCAKGSTSCSDNAPGRINNADLIYGFSLGDEKVDLVVASDRGLDKVAIYQVVPGAKGAMKLKDITTPNQAYIFSATQEEVNVGRTAYGLATAKSDKARAYVSQNNTPRVAVLELLDNGDGTVAYRTEQILDFPAIFPTADGGQWTPCTDEDGDKPQFEGMAADLQHNTLYLGQENVGLWRAALDQPDDESQWELFGKASDFGATYSRTWSEEEQEFLCEIDEDGKPAEGDVHLMADVEGLTLYQGANGAGYLLVSSQGDNTVAVYDRQNDNAYLGSFTVSDGTVDGVNETDGMMVVNTALPGAFSEGLLVMQDGENEMTEGEQASTGRESSNFKYVPWGDIARKLNLEIDTDDRSRLPTQ